MVMRYWGATNVYANTFADLVDPEAGGIHAEDLLRRLRDRGWGAESFSGDAVSVQAALRARRPAIVLVEDRPGRFHYVVIVGWSSGRVIAHDPARAPFRVLDERAFMEAWKRSGSRLPRHMRTRKRRASRRNALRQHLRMRGMNHRRAAAWWTKA